jgi:hypothetical protein
MYDLEIGVSALLQVTDPAARFPLPIVCSSKFREFFPKSRSSPQRLAMRVRNRTEITVERTDEDRRTLPSELIGTDRSLVQMQMLSIFGGVLSMTRRQTRVFPSRKCLVMNDDSCFQ